MFAALYHDAAGARGLVEATFATDAEARLSFPFETMAAARRHRLEPDRHSIPGCLLSHWTLLACARMGD